MVHRGDGGHRTRHHTAALHALSQRRIDGDDAPLRLARLRFEQFGLAAEIHGGSAAELEHTLAFLPRGGRPPMPHLPRHTDLVGLNNLGSGVVELFGLIV